MPPPFLLGPGTAPGHAAKVWQMETRPGPASTVGSAGPDVSPFSGPGLLVRVTPFALVAVAAEASLALPTGPDQWAGVSISLVLLAVVALAFLLPWDRLPGWMSVLVPLAYTGSALALTLAAGTVSGVGIVLLIPLIWTALFHHPWESACVLAATVAAEIVVSVGQSAPDVVIARRVLLWGALGALLAVATHGLRERIRRSQEAAARLQQRVGELMVVRDRDRLAADLQSSVVRRIFAVGLSLQNVLSLVSQAEVRRRLELSVADLDDTIRLLRQAIFGLENRVASQGLRQQVLRLCADVSPAPEITFAGPVDDALSATASDQLLDMLQTALGLISPDAVQTSVDLRADDALTVVVTGTGPDRRPADHDGHRRDFSPLCDRASQAGIAIDVGPAEGGTRLAWSVPVLAGPPPADRR
jgi:signal transduction histidine kinase